MDDEKTKYINSQGLVRTYGELKDIANELIGNPIYKFSPFARGATRMYITLNGWVRKI